MQNATPKIKLKSCNEEKNWVSQLVFKRTEFFIKSYLKHLPPRNKFFGKIRIIGSVRQGEIQNFAVFSAPTHELMTTNVYYRGAFIIFLRTDVPSLRTYFCSPWKWISIC